MKIHHSIRLSRIQTIDSVEYAIEIDSVERLREYLKFCSSKFNKSHGLLYGSSAMNKYTLR